MATKKPHADSNLFPHATRPAKSIVGEHQAEQPLKSTSAGSAPSSNALIATLGLDHCKGGLGIPDDDGSCDRFQKYQKPLAEWPSIWDTLSAREKYLSIYQRYADNTAQSAPNKEEMDTEPTVSNAEKVNPKEWVHSFKEAKQVLADELKARRERCSQPGTEEYDLLQEKNIEIDEDRAYRRANKIRGQKQKITVQRLFPEMKLEKEDEKGGLDFVFIAFEIYRKRLFPYTRAIQANNPDREVVITEDNDGSHLKARKLLAPEVRELERSGIRFANHPPNSPDMHPVEVLHREQNKKIQSYRFSVKTATKAAKAEADRVMGDSWVGAEFDDSVGRYAVVEFYKELADRCRASNGNNTFKDE
ncbi:hypothetical protein LTR08_008828 [Meristemomyces frigidus]|nr:hypothetical protein LTR08_008828 [Meristemomyces frigidus]